jgi:molecular chaperone GrpE
MMAEVVELRERLAEATQKSEEYVALAQRVQADFLNYKRRVEQEREETTKFAHSRLMLRLLPVLDDLERAMDSVRAELAGLHWVQGIGHINRKLQSVLEGEGLERIEALGAHFDPRQHEAVVFEEVGPDDDGKVTAVFQNGYKLHDRVIRPAMVKVGKGSPSRRAPSGQQQTGATFVEEDKNA